MHRNVSEVLRQPLLRQRVVKISEISKAQKTVSASSELLDPDQCNRQKNFDLQTCLFLIQMAIHIYIILY